MQEHCLSTYVYRSIHRCSIYTYMLRSRRFIHSYTGVKTFCGVSRESLAKQGQILGCTYTSSNTRDAEKSLNTGEEHTKKANTVDGGGVSLIHLRKMMRQKSLEKREKKKERRELDSAEFDGVVVKEFNRRNLEIRWCRPQSNATCMQPNRKRRKKQGPIHTRRSTQFFFILSISIFDLSIYAHLV